jgi:hypothetical protein
MIAGTDEEFGRMPPDGKGTPLTAEQIGLVRAWIDQGAWPDDARSKRLRPLVAAARRRRRYRT